MRDYDNNITDIRQERRIRKSVFNRESRITPAHIGAFVFVFVLIYLCINLFIYMHKEQVSIYEVQSLTNNHATEYDGICIRNEELVYTNYSGYINYYIQDKRKAAKSAVVYSLDSSENNIYGSLNSDYENYVLKDSEIAEIKTLIARKVTDSSCMDLTYLGSFNDEITDKLYDFVSANRLEAMTGLVEAKGSGSDFRVIRTPESGIISYHSDSLVGTKASDVDTSYFDNSRFTTGSLKSTGLLGKSDPVYRICSEDSWQIVAKVDEPFYMSHLETGEIDVQIDNAPNTLKASLTLRRDADNYFAVLSFDDCMSSYIDDRYVKVSFSSEEEKGLKIPISSITQKGYYLIPLSVFSTEEGYAGYVLKREIYDAQSGSVAYENVYPSKYYSDGFYAYIDMSLLNDGDYICNTETDERVKVGTVNYLDGVYCVNRGYYVFVRIEKIKSNQEYTIVKDNTSNGLRLYDHIALNASDAIEGNIIY